MVAVNKPTNQQADQRNGQPPRSLTAQQSFHSLVVNEIWSNCHYASIDATTAAQLTQTQLPTTSTSICLLTTVVSAPLLISLIV